MGFPLAKWSFRARQKGFYLIGQGIVSVSWGPILVARRLWENMELDRVINRLC